MENVVMTSVYSNSIGKKSIKNVIQSKVPPIKIAGQDFYFCGNTGTGKQVGDTLFRCKVVRALTSVNPKTFNIVGEDGFTETVTGLERILIIK